MPVDPIPPPRPTNPASPQPAQPADKYAIISAKGESMANTSSSFFAGLLASVIERVAGNRVTTIAGVLLAIGGTITAWAGLIPVAYRADGTEAVALLGAIALALSTDATKGKTP
jgi:hypothetical protein